jgi:hypothetical protein
VSAAALPVAISAASTAPTASGPASAESSTIAPTVGLRTRLIDVQRAASQLRSVQRGNGFLGLRGIGHFDKCEPARTPCVALGDYADLLDGAVRLEQRAQLSFSCTVRDIADKEFLHVFLVVTIKMKFTSAGRRQ